MLRVDKFLETRGVTVCFQVQTTKRIGHCFSHPIELNSIAEQWFYARRRSQLRTQLMLTTRRNHDPVASSLDSAKNRFIGGCITRVQGYQEIDLFQSNARNLTRPKFYAGIMQISNNRIGVVGQSGSSFDPLGSHIDTSSNED